MTNMVRDFIEVPECGSLDRLIECLRAARDRVPLTGQAQVRLRGDDVRGRSISISFLRPQTVEEEAGELGCGDSYLQSLLLKLGALMDSQPRSNIGAHF